MTRLTAKDGVIFKGDPKFYRPVFPPNRVVREGGPQRWFWRGGFGKRFGLGLEITWWSSLGPELFAVIGPFHVSVQRRRTER